MNEQQVQEKYIEMKMLQEKVKEMQGQEQLAESQLAELISTVQAMDDFKKAQRGTEILVPISSGIFARAELKDNSKLLVNVGAGVVVSKDIDGAKKLIDDQLNELGQVHSKISAQVQKLTMYAASIEQELRQMVSKE
ncbi:MAG TPA: prefoldin subunit alpha [Candidatus Nanoarchaeia archaeon]|nr:prefoldin subunit alpha [Candidatus Nanoarchaeia archaeon]